MNVHEACLTNLLNLAAELVLEMRRDRPVMREELRTRIDRFIELAAPYRTVAYAHVGKEEDPGESLEQRLQVLEADVRDLKSTAVRHVSPSTIDEPHPQPGIGC